METVIRLSIMYCLLAVSHNYGKLLWFSASNVFFLRV